MVVEESSAMAKVGEDSDDEEEGAEETPDNVKIVEVLKELPPNQDLIK